MKLHGNAALSWQGRRRLAQRRASGSHEGATHPIDFPDRLGRRGPLDAAWPLRAVLVLANHCDRDLRALRKLPSFARPSSATLGIWGSVRQLPVVRGIASEMPSGDCE